MVPRDIDKAALTARGDVAVIQIPPFRVFLTRMQKKEPPKGCKACEVGGPFNSW